MCFIIFLHFFYIYLFVCCSFVTFVSVLARGKTTLPHLTLSLQTEGKTFLLKGRHYTHYKSKTIFCRTFLFSFFLPHHYHIISIICCIQIQSLFSNICFYTSYSFYAFFIPLFFFALLCIQQLIQRNF